MFRIPVMAANNEHWLQPGAEILSREQVASRLGISLSTLNRLVNAGELPPGKRIGRKRVVWIEEDVVEWLRER